MIDEKRRLIRELIAVCETSEEAEFMYVVATRLNCDNMSIFDRIQAKVDDLNGLPYRRGAVYED